MIPKATKVHQKGSQNNQGTSKKEPCGKVSIFGASGGDRVNVTPDHFGSHFGEKSGKNTFKKTSKQRRRKKKEKTDKDVNSEGQNHEKPYKTNVKTTFLET